MTTTANFRALIAEGRKHDEARHHHGYLTQPWLLFVKTNLTALLDGYTGALDEVDRLCSACNAGGRRKSNASMNDSERSAWRVLLGLGARLTELAGKPALDLRPIRATSEKKLRLLVQGCLAVAGRSGSNRRHVDRAGVPVYVVTDDPSPPKRP
jgi:hypothetical protein